MSEPRDGKEIVGRGVAEGGRLFREWFSTFNIHLVFPEINSLQTAVRRVAHEYLNAAEDYGYSPDVCGYVKADVGVQLRGGEHPMGKIPRPMLAILTNACNTYLKWGEIWERFYHTRAFALDAPGSRSAKKSPARN